MGKYINQNSKGEWLPATGKGRKLMEDGAIIVRPEFRENLVCVVSNGLFEAVGYCFSEKEFEVWSDPGDKRPKMWLLYEHAKELAR
jgi:hypothetical protein